MVYTATYTSPVGDLFLAEEEEFLVGLWIEGQKYGQLSLKGEQLTQKDSRTLEATKHWLDRYFAGEKPNSAELPLAPKGSDFRQAVWKILCEIPYGTVITYGEIAKQMAEQKGISQMSAQAVGGAVGHNPISIVIPCHRVVGAKGSLTGYAGGIQKKIWLLSHEGLPTQGYSLPKQETAV